MKFCGRNLSYSFNLYVKDTKVTHIHCKAILILYGMDEIKEWKEWNQDAMFNEFCF